MNTVTIAANRDCRLGSVVSAAVPLERTIRLCRRPTDPPEKQGDTSRIRFSRYHVVMKHRIERIAAFALLSLCVGTVLVLAPALREQWYLSRLDSSDEATRRNASEKLAEIGSRRAVPRLVEVLCQHPSDNQHYSAQALVKIGRHAVPVLAEQLRKSDCNVATSAYVLERIGARAVPALIELLHDDNASVRGEAAYALGGIGEAAVPALMQARSGQNEIVSKLANAALKKATEPGCGGGSVLPPPIVADHDLSHCSEVAYVAFFH